MRGNPFDLPVLGLGRKKEPRMLSVVRTLIYSKTLDRVLYLSVPQCPRVSAESKANRFLWI